MQRREILKRLIRLEERSPAKGRWVEMQIQIPGGPAFFWDPDPDRPRKIIIPEHDDDA